MLRGAGGRQQHGVAVEVDGRGAVGLLGERADLEAHDVLAERAVVDDGFGEMDVGSLHGDSFRVRRRTHGRSVYGDRSSIEVRGRTPLGDHRRTGVTGVSREPLPRTEDSRSDRALRTAVDVVSMTGEMVTDRTDSTRPGR
ncbi:hypothetical protein SDC9_59555 [bioreactor metagenome]|uniref:Uncharacterized protein n=1 Tax=bioreactor metagenome TaxID=1076179 RepID=A0A644XAH0_9ZZZZ